MQSTSGSFIAGIYACFAFACTTPYLATRSKLGLKDDFCVLVANEGPDKIAAMTGTAAEASGSDSLLQKHLSKKEIDIAGVLGVSSLLEQWLRESRTPGVTVGAELLRINAAFQQTIIVATNEIDAAAAALHCEADRVARIAGYLDEMEKKKNNRKTIGAVLSGTLTTVAPVIITPQGLQNGVIVGGGAISTVLGIAVLGSNREKVHLIHQTNLLSAIWYGRNSSHVYPAFIWQLLIDPEFNEGDPLVSIQQSIKKRWLNIELAPSVSDHERELYFDQGGDFTEDELTTMATLLNQLEGSVRLLKAEIENLLKATRRLMEAETD